MSSNWSKLKAKLDKNKPVQSAKLSSTKKKVDDHASSNEVEQTPFPRDGSADSTSSATVAPSKLGDIKPPACEIDWRDKKKYVALDCEMVGIGYDGKQSALARCSVVDFDGKTLYDKHVRPPAFVTDFRTKWSGIRKHDLRAGHAISLAECQSEVARLLKGKILIGHALKNDLDVLLLSHPRNRIRDTSRFKPLMRPHGKKQGKFRPRALRDLILQHFKIDIQAGEHDSTEDARAAMYLYRLNRTEWEEGLTSFKNPTLNIAAFGGPQKQTLRSDEGAHDSDDNDDQNQNVSDDGTSQDDDDDDDDEASVEEEAVQVGNKRKALFASSKEKQSTSMFKESPSQKLKSVADIDKLTVSKKQQHQQVQQQRQQPVMKKIKR